VKANRYKNEKKEERREKKEERREKEGRSLIFPFYRDKGTLFITI